MEENNLNSINFKGDKYLLAMTILLIGLGMLVVYSSATARAVTSINSTESIFFRHLVMLFLGFGAMILFYKIPYKFIGVASVPLLVISAVLMVLVSISGIGKEINNASRWLVVPIANIQFQPSDLAKISVIIYVAASLSKLQNSVGDFKQILGKTVAAPLVIVFLISLNDMSTALLLTLIIGVVMYIGRVEVKVFASFFGVLLAISPFIYLLSKRVQTAITRVMDFLTASGKGISDMPYQVEQANIAIALGGFNGTGPGHSQQRYFLPEAFSDYIYAIIIEEHGFKVGVLVLFVFLGILWRGMKIVQRTKNAFSGLLVMGLSLLIVFQAMIHMAVVTGLFPVTGLTLPWVSMGGTSLLFTGIAFGIILNVSKETALG